MKCSAGGAGCARPAPPERPHNLTDTIILECHLAGYGFKLSLGWDDLRENLFITIAAEKIVDTIGVTKVVGVGHLLYDLLLCTDCVYFFSLYTVGCVTVCRHSFVDVLRGLGGELCCPPHTPHDRHRTADWLGLGIRGRDTAGSVRRPRCPRQNRRANKKARTLRAWFAEPVVQRRTGERCDG